MIHCPRSTRNIPIVSTPHPFFFVVKRHSGTNVMEKQEKQNWEETIQDILQLQYSNISFISFVSLYESNTFCAHDALSCFMTSGNYLRFCEPGKVLSPQCYASCLKTLMRARRNDLQSVMTTICISSQVSIITCHYITKGEGSRWHQKQSEIELPTFLYLKPNSSLNLKT